ncbi:MAG: hypothetical protein BalsKO_01790 [Balneolaceae bacterium]
MKVNYMLATDFGIVIYTLEGFFVSTSIVKLGSFERGIQVNDIDIFLKDLYTVLPNKE